MSPSVPVPFHTAIKCQNHEELSDHRLTLLKLPLFPDVKKETSEAGKLKCPSQLRMLLVAELEMSPRLSRHYDTFHDTKLSSRFHTILIHWSIGTNSQGCVSCPNSMETPLTQKESAHPQFNIHEPFSIYKMNKI